MPSQESTTSTAEGSHLDNPTGRARGHSRAIPVVRVGVTGHRPNGLSRADLPLLRQRVRECLQLICKTAVTRWEHLDQQAPILPIPGPPWLLSPLAEGADRIVAEEALDVGFELVCPLPFSIKEYERDFAGSASRQQFRILLRRASAVYELDGSRATPADVNRSYAAAGEVLISDADVLIAVWDGRAAKGGGGTAQVVQAAVESGTPVIWIESSAPHATHLVVGEVSGAWTRMGLGYLPAAMAGSGTERTGRTGP
jgi:hypothetical protein